MLDEQGIGYSSREMIFEIFSIPIQKNRIKTAHTSTCDLSFFRFSKHSHLVNDVTESSGITAFIAR